jgi:hypothetical protein
MKPRGRRLTSLCVDIEGAAGGAARFDPARAARRGCLSAPRAALYLVEAAADKIEV